MTHRSQKRPIVWTIAGSDSGGGAGIQADLKTMTALGVHGCSVITALTAQNTYQVTAVEPTSPALLEAQFSALKEDLPPAAIKTGMLFDATIVRLIAHLLEEVKSYIVCDPVITSSSGTALLDKQALSTLKHDLFPHVNLLTPNRMEAELLVGSVLDRPSAVEEAAEDLLGFGVKSVLIKGGHSLNDFCQDYWTNGKNKLWLTIPRQMNLTSHGTGCTLSAALASCKALGFEEKDTIVMAKSYVTRGLARSFQPSKNKTALLYHAPWPVEADHFPWCTETAERGQNRLTFSSCGPNKLGLYPIVDRFDWIKKLVTLGVTTVQLRVKNLQGLELEKEIQKTADYCRGKDCRLFINDYWDLAIKHNAYGVHLGQEDIEGADLKALHRCDLRLGISTHSYSELSKALSVEPSYLALGPILPHQQQTDALWPSGAGEH